jgi:hypothetical protein
MEAAIPVKKLGGVHQNTRRHMPEELLVSTIKTTSAQALSLKCQFSKFFLTALTGAIVTHTRQGSGYAAKH